MKRYITPLLETAAVCLFFAVLVYFIAVAPALDALEGVLV